MIIIFAVIGFANAFGISNKTPVIVCDVLKMYAGLNTNSFMCCCGYCKSSLIISKLSGITRWNT